MLQTLIKSLSVCVVFAAITGCVTNEYGSLSANADPEKAEATFVRLGLAYLQNGDRDTAKTNFDKALEINKRSAEANEGIARLYQMEAENELAEKHFKLALRYDNSLSRAYNNYGNFLFDQERYEEAYEQFDIASKNVSYTNRAAALLNLGRTALKLNRKDRAKAAFEHAASLRPNFALVLEELAEITFAEEDYAAAKQYLDQHDRLTRPTPRTLWVGIRLERIFGNRDKEASYALQLRNLHNYSQQYLEYKEWALANN